MSSSFIGWWHFLDKLRRELFGIMFFSKMECKELVLSFQCDNCPCKRMKCERHGNCAACKEHHHNKNSKISLTRCEKLKKKEEKREDRKKRRQEKKKTR